MTKVSIKFEKTTAFDRIFPVRDGLMLCCLALIACELNGALSKDLTGKRTPVYNA